MDLSFGSKFWGQGVGVGSGEGLTGPLQPYGGDIFIRPHTPSTSSLCDSREIKDLFKLHQLYLEHVKFFLLFILHHSKAECKVCKAFRVPCGGFAKPRNQTIY